MISPYKNAGVHINKLRVRYKFIVHDSGNKTLIPETPRGNQINNFFKFSMDLIKFSQKHIGFIHPDDVFLK